MDKSDEFILNLKSEVKDSDIKTYDENLQIQELKRAIEDDDISMLEVIWQKVSKKVQREFLYEIFLKYKYDESYILVVLWCATKKEVQEDNPEIFLEIIKGLNNEDREMVIENTSESLLESTIYDLLKINDLESLPINPLLAEKISYELNCNIPVIITIKNASELSVYQLEDLEMGLNIHSVKIGNDNYDIETYKACRKKIDNILEGIEFSTNQDDRQKYIFGQVIRKLANTISYDFELVRKEKDGLASKDERENARNLVGGLINEKCVCVGMAEILRNIVSCLGIECINIAGDVFNAKGEMHDDVHMWNQIKLDSEWFNIDFTFDIYRIIKMECPKYLLKSDQDFKDHFAPFSENNKCNRTIHINDLMNYLYGKDYEINKKYSDNSFGLE